MKLSAGPTDRIAELAHGLTHPARSPLHSPPMRRVADAKHGSTASALVLRPIVDYAAACGVDRRSLLADLGIREAALLNPDYRVADAVHARLWAEASAGSRDPIFGLHVAEHTPMGAYGALEYALRFSLTLKEAFFRMARFYRVLCDALATAVVVRGDVALVRRVARPHHAQESECLLAYLALRAREIAGPGFRLREVRFAHAAPADAAPHAALFGCPVHFASPADEIQFAARDLERQAHPVAPGLADVLDRHMLQILSGLPSGDDPVMERVSHAVAATLREQRRPTLRGTAAAIKASPRTLQRWLSERSVTHRDVVDRTRRDMAMHLLEKGAHSVTEIAFLLGFADVGGFARRFKRWTGRKPSSIRPRVA